MITFLIAFIVVFSGAIVIGFLQPTPHMSYLMGILFGALGSTLIAIARERKP